jgi:hypothetical protein
MIQNSLAIAVLEVVAQGSAAPNCNCYLDVAEAVPRFDHLVYDQLRAFSGL